MMLECGFEPVKNCGKTPIEQFWEHEAEANKLETFGDRVSLVRFLAWINGGKLLLKRWHRYRWRLQVLCQESDFLSQANFEKIKVSGAALADERAATSTEHAIPSVDSKSLRASCRNACVIGFSLLEDEDKRRLLAVMCHSAAASLEHLGSHQRECKSAEECNLWTANFIHGTFIRHLNDLWGNLTDKSIMTDCDFLKPLPRGDDSHHFLRIEDQWAALLANFEWEMVSNRLKRKLYMFGYPHYFSILSLPLTEELAQRVLDKFKEHYEAYTALKREADIGVVAAMRKRSVFLTVGVCQYLAGCKQKSWKYDASFQRVTREQTSHANNTLIAEELIGVGKNNKKIRGTRVFRRADLAYGHMLARKLPTKRYRWDDVEPSASLPSKKCRLGSEAFGKTNSEPSMPLKGVKSNKKDAPWYSPQAVQIGVNVADLAAQLYLEQTKQWGKIEKAGLSMICRRVPLIFCRKAESTSPDLGFDWHVGCFSYGKTAGIAWPVTLRSVPCHHDMQSWTVDFHNPDRTPRMLTILTLKNIYSRQSEWRSAAWLRQSFPFAGQGWQASVRAVVDSREDVPIAKAMGERLVRLRPLRAAAHGRGSGHYVARRRFFIHHAQGDDDGGAWLLRRHSPREAQGSLKGGR